MFFKPLRDKAKALGGLTMFDALRLLFSQKDVQEEVIRLNTEEQLFDKGIDSKGVSLEEIGGEYAPATIEIKFQSGLPFDRITLFQTGEFYDSFVVKAQEREFVIDADTVKGMFDLRERWGLEILGLTEQSKEDLAVLIREKIVDYLHEIL